MIDNEYLLFFGDMDLTNNLPPSVFLFMTGSI
jgi:hypothetical protein